MGAIKPRTTTVILYQGDDLDRLSALDDAVAKAAQKMAAAERSQTGTPLAHEGDPATEAREAHALALLERDEFAAEAEERGVKVHLIARPRLRWRELCLAHPARDDDDGDKMFGVNMATFPDELLPESVDPSMSSIEGDVGEFLDSLSDYDYYDRLFLAAFSLNRGAAPADPTQRLLSNSSQTSAATSS
jgi:hypothetical protein